MQPLAGRNTKRGGRSLFFPLSRPHPSTQTWQGLAGEVRLDEVELLGNEAVRGGEMRLYRKINEVVLSGNEVVLGGKVRCIIR